VTISADRIHRDLEIRWFYAIVAGLPIGFGLLALAIGEWVGFLGMTCIGLLFLVAGWPLSATVTVDGDVVFAAPLRRVRIGVDNLSSVKLIGPDHLPHLTLRRRWRLPVGYRFPNFTDASSLAAEIRRIIERSGARVKDDRVLQILEEVATSRVEAVGRTGTIVS
jgi:hypothetical protein